MDIERSPDIDQQAVPPLSEQQLSRPEVPDFDEKNRTILLQYNPGLDGIIIEADGLNHEGKHFDPKEEFHVTIVGFKTGGLIKKAIKADDTVADKIDALIANIDWKVSALSEKLHLSKDTTVNVKGGGEETVHRESIIQMVSVSGLEEFYEKLNDILGSSLETPPAHVTLYTHGDKTGIGVYSQADLESANPKEVTT